MFDKQLNNIKSLYSQKDAWIVSIFSAIIIGAILFYFTNFELLSGNFGKAYAWTQVIVQVFIMGLFGINISLLYQKLKMAGSIKASEKGTTALGGFLGVLVSGCPACGVTIASYLGLASIFTAFPSLGLTIKFIGIFLMLYSVNSLAKSLFECNIN